MNQKGFSQLILIIIVGAIVGGSVLFSSLKKEVPGNVDQAPSHAFNPFVDSSDGVKNCIKKAIGQDNFDAIVRNERPSTAEESKVTGSCAKQPANSDTLEEAAGKNDGAAGPASPQKSPMPQALAPKPEASSEPAKPTYAKTIVNDHPIHLSGNQVMEISDEHYIIANNVTLKNKAKLIIKNSLIEFKNDYSHQHIIEAYDNAEILVENSLLRSDKPMNWDFHGHSLLSLIGTKKSGTDDTWPWMTFSEDTSAIVRGSKFDATVWDRGNLSVEDSLTFIELVFGDNSTVDERLSADRTDFIFPGDNERGISYKVALKNSTIRGWGITVKTGSSITIRDGYRVVSTVQIGWPWTGKTVVLDGLEQKVYQDQTWRIEDSTLRLVKTDVWLWSPGAFMDNTLIMRNSFLSDLAFGGDTSTTIVENSRIYFVRARDNQKFEIKDSYIESDVVATENSLITLTNTQVGGKIVEQGNGRVIRQ